MPLPLIVSTLRAAALSAAVLAAGLFGGAACAGPAAEAPAAAPQPKVEAAAKIDAPPAAVHLVDAPGLNVEDLSARLRDAVALTSGLDVVDEPSVRAELAACTEAPCPDAVASKFKDAAFIVASSVSRIGDTFLCTVRVQRGAKELVRAVAQAPDAGVSIQQAGHEAGAKLREELLAEGAAENVATPPAPDAAPAGSERDDEGGAG